MPTRIAIHGAAGRMGQRLVALASQDDGLEIVDALDSAGHPKFGVDAGTVAGIGEIKIRISDDLSESVAVVIDFSVPAGAAAITAKCVGRKIPLVMATTGLFRRTTAKSPLCRRDHSRRLGAEHELGGQFDDETR